MCAYLASLRFFLSDVPWFRISLPLKPDSILRTNDKPIQCPAMPSGGRGAAKKLDDLAERLRLLGINTGAEAHYALRSSERNAWMVGSRDNGGGHDSAR